MHIFSNRFKIFPVFVGLSTEQMKIIRKWELWDQPGDRAHLTGQNFQNQRIHLNSWVLDHHHYKMLLSPLSNQHSVLVSNLTLISTGTFNCCNWPAVAYALIVPVFTGTNLFIIIHNWHHVLKKKKWCKLVLPRKFWFWKHKPGAQLQTRATLQSTH